MNKKRIIIGTIIVFTLSALFHSVYDNFPNFLTSLFFPVNESIWEHNKLVLLSFFIWTIIEKLFFKPEKSVTLMNLVATILCIFILDITFTPIYLYILDTNDNFVITLIIYFISIILSFIISEKFILEQNKKVENLSLIGFVIISVFLMILTYNPLEYAIFYDFNDNIYGIKEK